MGPIKQPWTDMFQLSGVCEPCLAWVLFSSWGLVEKLSKLGTLRRLKYVNPWCHDIFCSMQLPTGWTLDHLTSWWRDHEKTTIWVHMWRWVGYTTQRLRVGGEDLEIRDLWCCEACTLYLLPIFVKWSESIGERPSIKSWKIPHKCQIFRKFRKKNNKSPKYLWSNPHPETVTNKGLV